MPQSVEPSSAQSKFEIVHGLLERVTRSDNVACALYEALVQLEQNCEGREGQGSVTLEQRGKLLSALVRAHACATRCLPADYAQLSINAGMAAAACQIQMWAENPHKASRRKADEVRDIHDRARAFREDIRERIPDFQHGSASTPLAFGK